MKQIKNWGNALMLSLAYFFIVIYALIFTNETGWTLLLFASLLILIELISILGSLRRLQLTTSEQLMMHLGEQAELTLEITKRRQYPLILFQTEISSVFFKQSIFFYFFNTQKNVQVSWLPEQRGYYQKLPVQVISRDFFGWFQKKQTLELNMTSFVLPEFSNSAETAISYFQQILQRSSYGEPSFTVKNYRPYRAGDALKQIDWKASSRQQELIYREYQQFQTSEWIFIFYGQDSFYFEEMLSVFYSLQRQFPQIPAVLLGKKSDAFAENDLRQYALIQPLKASQSLPDFHQKRIFLFTPKYSEDLEQQIASLQQDNQVTVYTYKELMKTLGIEVAL
jgi:hypothetical protein